MEHTIRPVIMYIGIADNTWYLEDVNIPINTSKVNIGKVAISKMIKELDENEDDFVFVGVYNIPPLNKLDSYYC